MTHEEIFAEINKILDKVLFGNTENFLEENAVDAISDLLKANGIREDK